MKSAATPPLNILVLGAGGLLGRAVCASLLAAGHRVTGFGNVPPAPGVLPAMYWCAGDFSRRLRPRHWRSELPGVDVVINTIGVFQERFLQTFAVIHDEAPAALWEACVHYGVKRVIHVSALGAAADAPTEYWRSKARGDARLLARTEFDAWVVRPSLVYADEGESATLFRQWAALPVLPVPVSAGSVQPIHRDDLAELIVHLATAGGDAGERVIEAVGPKVLPWRAWLQTLRTGMGLAPVGALVLPRWLVRCGVWLAALRPHSLQTADSLRMLEAGNVGELGAAPRLESLLGRPLRSPETFASPVLGPAAVIATWQPLARLSLAVVWLLTALVSLLWVSEGLQLLAEIGLSSGWRWPALLAGIALDAAFGILTLWRPSRRLWLAQLVLVFAYTLIITIGAPHWWLHPFGPISKNLPILALLWGCAALEKK